LCILEALLAPEIAAVRAAHDHSASKVKAVRAITATSTWYDHPTNPIQYPPPLILRGQTMANLNNALQQLRAEHGRAQLEVEKLGQAISAIESLHGSGASRKGNQPKRIISAASRRKMALAQKARWAKIRKGSQPAAGVAKITSAAPVKHTMSASARRKIAAAQRARWAKLKAGSRIGD
jgi:hypothetical protein